MECYAAHNKILNKQKIFEEATLYNVSFGHDPGGNTMTVYLTNVTLENNDKVAFLVMICTDEYTYEATDVYCFRTELIDDELQITNFTLKEF